MGRSKQGQQERDVLEGSFGMGRTTEEEAAQRCLCAQKQHVPKLGHVSGTRGQGVVAVAGLATNRAMSDAD